MWSDLEQESDQTLESITVPRLLELNPEDDPLSDTIIHGWLRGFLTDNKKQNEAGIQKGIKTMMGLDTRSISKQSKTTHANIMGTVTAAEPFQLPKFHESAQTSLYFLRLAEEGFQRKKVLQNQFVDFPCLPIFSSSAEIFAANCWSLCFF